MRITGKNANRSDLDEIHCRKQNSEIKCHRNTVEDRIKQLQVDRATQSLGLGKFSIFASAERMVPGLRGLWRQGAADFKNDAILINCLFDHEISSESRRDLAGISPDFGDQGDDVSSNPGTVS